MAPLLRIFCGKGGVGKTNLSLALGLLLARQGKRALVITSHPLQELALSVSLEGLDQADPEAAAKLFVVHIDPKRILASTVREQIPTQTLARKVLSSKLYQSLVEVAPGLKEIAFLSRLKELTEVDGRNGEAPYDEVIWDAPATGHFLQTLRATLKFESYLTGPFAERGRELAQFFSDARLDLFPVSTMEELAVEETLELCAHLASDLNLHPDGLICNMVSPLLTVYAGGPDKSLAELSLSAGTNSLLQFVLERHQTERHHFDRLRSGVKTPCYLIERVGGWQSDLQLLFRLVDRLTPLGERCAF